MPRRKRPDYSPLPPIPVHPLPLRSDRWRAFHGFPATAAFKPNSQFPEPPDDFQHAPLYRPLNPPTRMIRQ